MSNDSSTEQNNENTADIIDTAISMTENLANDDKSKKNENTAVDTEEKLIYLGPSLPKEGLKRFCIYKNGLPETIKNIFNDYPEAKRLFVKVENMSKVLNEIENKGSSYHTWYEKILNRIKGV